MAARTKAVESAKQTKSATSAKLVPPADLFDRVQQLHDSVKRRAFEIFEGNGGIHGRDLEDWFRAESELTQPVKVHVADTEGDLTVRADVPGFAGKELEVSVEPRRVTVVGRREISKEEESRSRVYKEGASDQILRVVDLPTDVDPAKALASVKGGVLELKMPKANPARKV